MAIRHLILPALLLAGTANLPVYAQTALPRPDRILDVAPSDGLPVLKEVEALQKAGKHADADKRFAEIRLADPGRVEPVLFLGQNLYERNPAASRPVFQQALAIDADNSIAQAFLARLDAREGKLDAARARLNMADGRRPDSLELRLARADVELWAKDSNRALTILQNALPLARSGMETSGVQFRMADAYFGLQRWREAELALDKVMAATPHPVRQLQRGDARANQGKIAEAIADYEAAGKLDGGKDPKFTAAVAARIDAAKKAAPKPLVIEPGQASYYYTFVTVDDYLRAKTTSATYHCKAGAFVFAIKEILKQPSPSDFSEAPIRKVGSSAPVGRVVLAPDILDPWKLTLMFAKMDSPADQEALKDRTRIKFCPTL